MAEKTKKLSRVGKKPVAVTKNVDVTITGQTVQVKGPKGELSATFLEDVSVVREGDELIVNIEEVTRTTRARQGLTRALLANMMHGVSEGFERVLEINGVGYRADMKGQKHILFQLGHSHPILFELPESVSAEVSKDNKITLRSIDKEALGHAAAQIRSFRPPEPYKGKGIKYKEEVIKRKAGKAAAR